MSEYMKPTKTIKRVLKHIADFCLRPVGFEVRKKQGVPPAANLLSRMYDFRESMEEVLDHLVELGLSPATVIDVGVASGTPALYTRFPHAKHLLIEPLQEFEQSMQTICSRYDADYVLAAAGAAPGEMEIGISADLQGSSLLRSKGDKRNIPVVTLDGICSERRLSAPYVVKVDVQGAELQVLAGAVSTLQDAELVILEVSFFHFTDAFPDFYDVVDYMKQRGFVVYEVFGGHNRPLDGARGQADIAFVKECGEFRESHQWATPEQVAEFERLKVQCNGR
jgi:FkbM family methyltransferase